MCRDALLLIDLQEEYLARPNLVPPRAELIASIASALAGARAAGEPVFHIRTGGSLPMPHRSLAPDATPPPELTEHTGEPLFTKRFFSAFDAPGLDDALEPPGSPVSASPGSTPTPASTPPRSTLMPAGMRSKSTRRWSAVIPPFTPHNHCAGSTVERPM